MVFIWIKIMSGFICVSWPSTYFDLFFNFFVDKWVLKKLTLFYMEGDEMIKHNEMLLNQKVKKIKIKDLIKWFFHDTKFFDKSSSFSYINCIFF